MLHSVEELCDKSGSSNFLCVTCNLISHKYVCLCVHGLCRPTVLEVWGRDKSCLPLRTETSLTSVTVSESDATLFLHCPPFLLSVSPHTNRKLMLHTVCYSLWKALQEPPRTELPLHSHTPGRRGGGRRLWATHATLPAQEQPQAWVFCRNISIIIIIIHYSHHVKGFSWLILGLQVPNRYCSLVLRFQGHSNNP